MASLVGCGGYVTPPTTPQAPSFTFTTSSNSAALVAGGASISITLLATAQNGFTSPVQVSLTGLPAGVTVQPSTLITLVPGSATQITLSASSAAAIGSATVTLTAYSGTLYQVLTFNLTVSAPPIPPDFFLSLSTSSLNLNQAQLGQTFQVTAVPLHGFTGNVAITLGNLPSGVTASPAIFTLAPGVAQSVTLTASATATLGTGSVSITATFGSLSHAGTVALTVYLAGIINGPFTHPGIWHSQADLDRMKAKVAAGVEPYKSAFAYFANMGYSSYTNTGQGPFTYETYAHGQFEIRNDAQVAHQNAIMWYITGDTRYRDNAIHIMNSWASTMTAFDVTDVLTAGTCIRDFANAGEIIRATGNGAWAPADITKFQNWLLTLIYPALLGSTTATLSNVTLYPAGFGGLQTAGLITLGVFCDRADIYNFAVTTYQHHTNGSIGLQEYIDISGQNYENQRDVGHPSGNLATFAQNAYVVWNQGQDVFFLGNNLLAKAFESQAKFDLGWDVAPIPFLSADGHMHIKMSGENRTPVDNLDSELIYSIFHGVKGLNLPYTKLSADYKFPAGTAAGGSFYFLNDDSGQPRVAPLIGAPAPTGVMLYEDELSGSYLTHFMPGVYSHAQLLAGGMQIYGSGAVTSMKVPIGWTVTIYTGDNQTGASYTATGTLANQGIIDLYPTGFNDALYSMTVTAGNQPYPVFSTTYELINQNSGSDAEIASASVKAGATLDQSVGTTAETQLWRVQNLGHNQFLFQNINSNLAMEVSSALAGTGTTLDQQTFVPEPDLATGGTASASADNAANGEGAAQAFDQSINTKWFDPATGGTATLQYKLPQPSVVDTYILVSAGDVPQRDPASWQFQGSNDGINWTTLDTQTAQAFPNRQQAISYSLANIVPFTWYRLNVTANQGGSSYGVQMAEMFLYSSLSGSINQRWTITSVPNTTLGTQFTIVNAATGQAMDVNGASAANGAAIVQNANTNAPSQRWALQIPALLLP